MDSAPNSTRQTQFLLTNLIILSVLILGLVLLIAAYPSLLAPAPTRTPSLTPTLGAGLNPSLSPTITPTPTLTRTLRPTPTSTVTPTATYSPTPGPSPTPAGPATLTPAVPAANNLGYLLIEWSAEDAARLVDLIEDYPNTLAVRARGADNAAYFAAFDYAVLAFREALLRFPDAPQADGWRWRLAYNLARSGDPEAAAAYAQLAATALNRGVTTLAELPDWLVAHEPRLALSVLEFSPPTGYLSSNVLLLNGASNPIYPEGSGAAALWLLETASAYTVEPLFSAFDFSGQPTWQALATDLTGDQQPEVVLYPSPLSGQTGMTLPRIFDLSQVPAKELFIQPGDEAFDLGVVYEAQWEPGSVPNRKLVFSARVFPACPFILTRTFAWDSSQFLALDDTQARFEGKAADPVLCGDVVDHAARFWGSAVTISLYDQLKSIWPTAIETPDLYAYRLGLLYALAGDTLQSTQVLERLVSAPTLPGSPYAELAADFLAVYQGPDDLYRACLALPDCDPQAALAELDHALPADPAQAFTRLAQFGVAQTSSGYFDFDGDGQKERWFSIRHRPLAALQLWVLAASPSGSRLLPLGVIQTTVPRIELLEEGYIAPGDLSLVPATIIEGHYAVRLLRRPSDGEPFFTPVMLRATYPDRFKEALAVLESELLEGAPAADLAIRLARLEQNPGLLCKNTWSCDRYLYLRGLAQELADDEPGALTTYLELWRNYSKSPFTVMARLKLGGSATLQTITPTLNVTPSGTPTPTATGPTPTPTTTPTPGPTRTPTVPGTPYVPPATPTVETTRVYP